MALESVAAAESLIQSNADNDDLEDGEIPSDEDDEPTTLPAAPEPSPPPTKPSSKSEPSQKEKNSDSKSSKSKNKPSTTTTTTSSNSGNKSDRFSKYKSPSEDWAGDVEKAIRAVLDEDKPKSSENKSKNKSSSRNKNRKRSRDEREDDRTKDHKKRRMSDDENGNEDDDEMLFVRGASPSRKDHDTSPPLGRRSPIRRSPGRRSNDRENFDNNSDRDSEERLNEKLNDRPGERSNRHRDDKRGNSTRGSTPRRNQKNERGGKNKNRGQSRNDRNNSRRNQSDADQGDTESICVYFMQGKCHRGDDCPYSHNALPPRKMELCKFYLMDCCAKREKCLYMHHDFPCKFFHTGFECVQGAKCKFSHDPLNEQVKNILLKHIETAPKEILGNFPRLSREKALSMINNTARNIAQGQDPPAQKIPSLFDVTLPASMGGMNSSAGKEDENSSLELVKRGNNSKSKSAGKKTRWGSNEDRVPLEQIMLLQSVNLRLPNVVSMAVQQQLQQRLILQQCIKSMELYSDNMQSNPSDNLKDDEDQSKSSDTSSANPAGGDIDLRQLLSQHSPNKGSKMSSIADVAASWGKSKFDEESDRDEESGLVIEDPVDEEENKTKEKSSTSGGIKQNSEFSSDLKVETNLEIPQNFPTQAQELFMKIQQQQRAAREMVGNDENAIAVENAMKDQEEWYSDESDDDNDDDDDESGNLQIVIKDNQSEKSDQESPWKENPEKITQPSSIPQPAVIADTLGDLSKNDISAKVSKLLSSIKTHSSLKKELVQESSTKENIDDKFRHTSPDSDRVSSLGKVENGGMSPMNSPSTSSASVSRDPRKSRDPRQRRVEESIAKTTSPTRSDLKKEARPLRLETSIYSSGITSADTGMDTDFRSRLDQDHRRKDMDLRQRYQDFGDTDLRVVGGTYESTLRTDVDFRQMLPLPFKPAPAHVPCTEIDASISSHAPVTYKVYVVDIPRPNYTGLKLSKNDSAVKFDPRLRKIFRIFQAEIADSPMSPPPMAKPETPKSPPPIRADPRRKAMELANQGSSGGNTMPQGPGSQDIPIGMQGPTGMGMGMGSNQMMGGMPQMGGMLNPSMQSSNMGPMSMSGMGNVGPGMGPNGPMMPSNQMGFDPVYNNGGPGLLGAGPPMGYPDVGPNYDGPGYGGGNYGNFGPGPNEPMMGYGLSGQNPMNYGPDWASNNQGPMRRGGRVRRRNRNKVNTGPGNRGNRSPP